MHLAAISAVFAAVFFVTFIPVRCDEDHSHDQKIDNDRGEKLLLVISIDGFTHTSVSPDATPNLYSLGVEGVQLSSGIVSLVNTVTASNHHCISTGLYQEAHGIIDNTFYDRNFKQFYDVWNFHNDSVVANNSLDRKWYGGVPVWETYEATKEKKVGLVRWPMCNIPSPLDRLKLCHPWEANNHLADWKLDVDMLVDMFTSKGVEFGMLYIPEPDHTQHSNDLQGPVVAQVIKDIDSLIGYLKAKFFAAGLWDHLNLIITGDHGHEAVDLGKKENLVILDEELDPEMVKSLFFSSNSYFLTPDSKFTAQQIYQRLEDVQRAKNLSFHVWRKEDFPARYHWKDSPRVGPLIVFPKRGALVALNRTREYMLKAHSASLKFGTHGYLNDEVESMRPLFIARGPALRKGFSTDSTKAQLVDVYLLICAILDLNPTPNNGTFDHVAELLNPGLAESFRAKLNSPEGHWRSGGDDLYRFVEENQSSLVVAISIVLPSICCVAYLISCIFCGRHQFQKVPGGSKSHLAGQSSRENFSNGTSTPTNGSSKGAMATAKRQKLSQQATFTVG